MVGGELCWFIAVVSWLDLCGLVCSNLINFWQGLLEEVRIRVGKISRYYFPPPYPKFCCILEYPLNNPLFFTVPIQKLCLKVWQSSYPNPKFQGLRSWEIPPPFGPKQLCSFFKMKPTYFNFDFLEALYNSQYCYHHFSVNLPQKILETSCHNKYRPII